MKCVWPVATRSLLWNCSCKVPFVCTSSCILNAPSIMFVMRSNIPIEQLDQPTWSIQSRHFFCLTFHMFFVLSFNSLHLLYGSGKVKQESSGVLQVVAGNDGKPVPQFSSLARWRHTFGRLNGQNTSKHHLLPHPTVFLKPIHNVGIMHIHLIYTHIYTYIYNHIYIYVCYIIIYIHTWYTYIQCIYIYMHVWNDVVIGTQNYVCIHMPASTCKQESSMVYGVARKFFATQSHDTGLPKVRRDRDEVAASSSPSSRHWIRIGACHGCHHEVIWSFIRRRRWKEEVCDSVWPKQLTSRPFILAVLPFVLSSCIGRTILAAWTAWTELEPQTLSLRKSKILWVQLLDTDVIQTFPTWKLLWR